MISLMVSKYSLYNFCLKLDIIIIGISYFYNTKLSFGTHQLLRTSVKYKIKIRKWVTWLDTDLNFILAL